MFCFRRITCELFLFVCITLICGDCKQPAQLPSMQGLSLEKFVEKNWIYVDKTWFVDLLVQSDDRYFFLSRPRRFGKTLFIDTLFHYFTGDSHLFRNMNISKKYDTDSWPKYPIIRLDFSELQTTSADKLEASLIEILQDEAVSNGFHLPVTNNVNQTLKNLIQKLKQQSKSDVVILIDEYDCPVTSVYPNQSLASENLAILQDFFHALKSEYENIIFCFITGITKLPLANFSSGFNAVRDISFNTSFAAIVGFTEEELTTNFKESIENIARIREVNTTVVLEEMKEWYDGFQFTPGPQRVYNPCSVISYLRSGNVTNYWTETGGSGSYLTRKMGQFMNFTVAYLMVYHTSPRLSTFSDTRSNETNDPLLVSPSILSGQIEIKSNDSSSLLCLLYDSGYFSLNGTDEGGNYRLRFTNRELEDDYQKRIVFLTFGIYESPEKMNKRLGCVSLS